MLDVSLRQLELSDWLANGLVLIATVAMLWLFSRPSMRRSTLWQATVTPLASIIGSGFLVVAPLLGSTVGNWSIVAVGAIVALAYLVGGVVRYNICHVEPIIESNEANGEVDQWIRWLGKAAKVSLTLAYVVAIAFYLKLLGAFVMRLFHVDGANIENWIATCLAVFIGGFGFWRGLDVLEWLEKLAVDVKLSIIVGLLVGLMFVNGELLLEGKWRLPDLQTQWDLPTFRRLLGTFLIVQGFETSRYLRGAYPPEHRIRTMRLAQGIAAVVYLAFVGLSTVLLDTFETVSETGIIDLSSQVAFTLPFLLVLGAAMSQFSAAVADTVGSGGLVEEVTGGQVHRRWTYAGAVGLALMLLWTVDIFSVISYASRAFALYYAVQCSMAALHAISHDGDQRNSGRAVWFSLLACLMLATAVLGIPAETAGDQGNG
jgi:hypothetical protein